MGAGRAELSRRAPSDAELENERSTSLNCKCQCNMDKLLGYLQGSCREVPRRTDAEASNLDLHVKRDVLCRGSRGTSANRARRRRGRRPGRRGATWTHDDLHLGSAWRARLGRAGRASGRRYQTAQTTVAVGEVTCQRAMSASDRWISFSNTKRTPSVQPSTNSTALRRCLVSVAGHQQAQNFQHAKRAPTRWCIT